MVNDFGRALRAAKEVASRINMEELHSLEEIVAAMERVLGLKIKVRPLPENTKDTLTGALLVKPGERVVMYSDRGLPHFRDRVIGHELGHIMFDHPGDCNRESAASTLLPDLDPEMVLRVLRRESFETPEEREAEAFSDVVVKHLRAAATRRGQEPGAFGDVFG